MVCSAKIKVDEEKKKKRKKRKKKKLNARFGVPVDFAKKFSYKKHQDNLGEKKDFLEHRSFFFFFVWWRDLSVGGCNKKENRHKQFEELFLFIFFFFNLFYL